MTRAGAAPLRILVVCTGNSARSILGEALLRRAGGDRVEVHSAGTEPRGINPLTLEVLAEAGLPTEGFRSKAVTEFLGQQFDYVITVCDNARDTCPVFPGVHQTIHWSLPDPAAVEGTREERLAAFRAVFRQLGERVHKFIPIAERFAAGRHPVELS